MNKISKVLIILMIIFSVFTYFYKVSASGINMNLSTDRTTYGSSTSSSSSTTNNTNQQSSVMVSSTTPNSANGLTISDMISIVLCAVGIILVLLGIAILIKQRS